MARGGGGRVFAVVAGVVLLLIGGVWIGQGLGLIPGSFMTGDRTWFYIGTVLVLVGLILIVAGALPRRGRRARR